MTTTAPGKMFLKVVGILLIIGGALSILMAILAIAGGGLLGAAAIGSGGNDAATAGVALGGGILIIAGIVALIGGVFNLVSGILGVKNCDKPEKAKSCFTLGIIMVVFAALNLILNIVLGSGGSQMASNISSGIAGFLLPVLYLVGAIKNKKAAE